MAYHSHNTAIIIWKYRLSPLKKSPFLPEKQQISVLWILREKKIIVIQEKFKIKHVHKKIALQPKYIVGDQSIKF